MKEKKKGKKINELENSIEDKIEKHVNSTKHKFGNYLNISHFGSLTNDRSLMDILKVLPSFFSKYPQAKKHLRFNIFGSRLDSKSRNWISKSAFTENIIEHGRLEFDFFPHQTKFQKIFL